MQAAQNAAKISDPGRRMVAEQEGRAKEVNRTREVMAMLRDAQTNPKVRRAIIAQAERQGNISPAIQAAKYNLSDPLKRDTDTRTALLKLPKTATLTS
jgi:ribosomal protein L4